MAKYNTYPYKNAPESGDTILIYDTTNDANKQIYFTVFFNWVIGLLRSFSLTNLTTTSKTIEGSINEVKSTADSAKATADATVLTQAQINSLIDLIN